MLIINVYGHGCFMFLNDILQLSSLVCGLLLSGLVTTNLVEQVFTWVAFNKPMFAFEFPF